ncbi:MAG: hypothetical protein AAGD06_01660 [Acidobacteriota bacterium]
MTHRLTSLVAGDRSAAEWLYDTFAPGLHRRIRGRYGGFPGVDADDLLQDAFVFYFQRDAKVLRDFLERVEPHRRTQGRLERHLWDLACGLAANRRRAAAVRKDTRSLTDDGETAPEVAVDDGSEDRLLDRDQLKRLDRCLVGRGRRLAIYYRLRFWDGYGPAEISEMTGWSMKATYKLRQALGEAVGACLRLLGLGD